MADGEGNEGSANSVVASVAGVTLFASLEKVSPISALTTDAALAIRIAEKAKDVFFTVTSPRYAAATVTKGYQKAGRFR